MSASSCGVRRTYANPSLSSRSGEARCGSGTWRSGAGRACFQREDHARCVEARDDGVRRSDAERGDESRAGERAGDFRRVLRGPLYAHRAHEVGGRHGVADEGCAHADVRRLHEAHHRGDREHVRGRQRSRESERHQRDGLRRVKRAHGAQHGALAGAIARYAEQRREQRAEITQRCEYRQQQDRARLHEHVPAEDERFHLERPRGRDVGGPLKPEAADLEGRKRRGAYRDAQDGKPAAVIVVIVDAKYQHAAWNSIDARGAGHPPCRTPASVHAGVSP